MNTSPAFTTISGWCALSGMGRTATFEAVRRGDLPARKPTPRKTLIDVAAGLEWLRSCPPACASVRNSPNTTV